MKLVVLCVCTWIATSLNQINQLTGEVLKTFSDEQIKAVERQVLQEYDIKVVITVIKRDSRGNIVHVDCKRYSKEGRALGGCSSDNFGRLIVAKTGCRIADVGYESTL